MATQTERRKDAGPLLQLARSTLASRGFDPESTSVVPLTNAVGREAWVFRVTRIKAGDAAERNSYCLKAYFPAHTPAQESSRPGWHEFQLIRTLNAEGWDVPLPVDYIEEIDGYLMEWFEGVNLRPYLLKRLLLPLPPWSMASTIDILQSQGDWLRRFQAASPEHAADTSVRRETEDSNSILRSSTQLPKPLKSRLAEVFEKYADLSVPAVRSHGQFSARNHLFRLVDGAPTLCVIDWKEYGWRHRFFDLHEMTLNFLFWACMPGMSVGKARRFGAAVERGYFGDSPFDKEAYWVTRSLHMLRAFRSNRVPAIALVGRMATHRWSKIAKRELETCITNLS